MILLVSSVQHATSVTRGIRSDEKAFPFVADLVTRAHFDWTKGRVAEYLSSSSAVRVSVRGVRFVHHWFTVVLDTEDTRQCTRSHHALCVTTSPWAHVFPTESATVVLGAHNHCTESETGRTLRLKGSNDISLCDLFSGSRNILVTIDGYVENTNSMLGPVVQGILSLLAVYVVGCIVHHFVGGDSNLAGSLSCTTACVSIVFIVIFMHDP